MSIKNIMSYLNTQKKNNIDTLLISIFFENKEKMLVEITISANDYYLLKKYFEKYNVRIDNRYKEF